MNQSSLVAVFILFRPMPRYCPLVSRAASFSILSMWQNTVIIWDHSTQSNIFSWCRIITFIHPAVSVQWYHEDLCDWWLADSDLIRCNCVTSIVDKCPLRIVFLIHDVSGPYFHLPFIFCHDDDILTFQSLPVTWCTNSLTFNNCTFCPHCIYVFCIYLRTNWLLPLTP
jgi:hypothetical protein